MTMRLPELLSGFGAINVPDLEVSELVQDSRAVTPGVAFVALAGQRADVLRHAQQAQARGAVAVLSEAALLSFDGTNGNAGLNAATDLAIPQIVVPDLAQNLPRLAQRFFADPGAKLSVIGVTGTNGKTSTVQLLAQALSLLGVRTASQGTLGAGMHGALRPGSHTTPEVLTTYRFLAQSAAAGASHIAMEVSSHALVQQRVQGVPFQVAIFTNLTRDHLDYHGTLEAYGAAKAKLFAWPGLSYAVINCDDPFGVSLLAATSAKHKLSFGMHPAAQVRASQVQLHAQGSAFRLDSPWGHTEIRCGLLGRFNVSNVLAVLATLGALGFSLSEMAAALKQVTAARLRYSNAAPSGIVESAWMAAARSRSRSASRAITTAVLARRSTEPTRASSRTRSCAASSGVRRSSPRSAAMSTINGESSDQSDTAALLSSTAFTSPASAEAYQPTAAFAASVALSPGSSTSAAAPVISAASPRRRAASATTATTCASSLWSGSRTSGSRRAR